ncbi:MAG: hypothetical protein CM1200mP30_27850 [Pseudomonadota bacterium]|nr:MAG: hypothetical protein CM1200mP30_27850 [Pseudomonadota bacterium]
MNIEESNSRISYLPTDGLTYDPSDSKYWDQEALDKEIERTFEICQGCRMCFKYCDSFPNLFNLLDNKYDGEVKKIKPEDTIQIMDACFQCKLCEVSVHTQYEMDMNLKWISPNWYIDIKQSVPKTSLRLFVIKYWVIQINLPEWPVPVLDWRI